MAQIQVQSFILVKNNTASIHRYDFVSKEGLVKSVTLMPGVNEVDDGAWAKVATDNILNHYVEEDGFVILGKTDEKTSPLLKAGGGKEINAIKMVQATCREELLTRWNKLETRRKVKIAIAAQLKRLELTEEEIKRPKWTVGTEGVVDTVQYDVQLEPEDIEQQLEKGY